MLLRSRSDWLSELSLIADWERTIPLCIAIANGPLEARMFISPVMLLPYMCWRRWVEMVVAQWLPLSERADASAQAELNVVQPDAPARYVG